MAKTKRAKRLRILDETRFERLGQEAICGSCNSCVSNKWCDPARTSGSELRSYSGIRLTSDGFDCALPVTIDSHSHCSFECVYCFSENLAGHVDGRSKGLGQMSLEYIDRVWSGGGGKYGAVIRKALKFDRPNEHGFNCPVQLGGINDPGDNYERQQGWLLKFFELMIKHNQPVRISTKGRTIALPEYQRVIARAPHLFWFAFSIISPDDDLLPRVDIKAPSPSERIATMKAMADLGCKTSLRFRPIMPGLSDATPKHPRAYEDLVNMAAEAGARAISFETCFVPTLIPADQKKKWDRMESIIQVPLKDIYKKLSSGNQACLRPSYYWTEDIMHAIAGVAKRNGMTIGVSDPTWKQLTETGCCCGILPDDPVFGNWERENATNGLLRAKRTPGLVLRKSDIIPPWAKDLLQTYMTNMGPGPTTAFAKRHLTWADKLASIWDDIESERGPLSYFQGALQPVKLDDGEIGYTFKGLDRQEVRAPYWRIRPTKDPVPQRVGCNACGTEAHGHEGQGIQIRCRTHLHDVDGNRFTDLGVPVCDLQADADVQRVSSADDEKCSA